MDEAALVRLAKRCGDADGEAQERPVSMGGPSMRSSGSPPGSSSSSWSDRALAEAQRPRGPGAVQLVPQSIFVCEAMKRRRRLMVRCGKRDQNGRIPVVASNPTSAVEDALALVRQKFEIAESVDVDLKPRMQLLDSAALGTRRR